MVVAIVQVTTQTPASLSFDPVYTGFGFLDFLTLFPIYTPAVTSCSEYVMALRLDAAGEVASQHTFWSERQSGTPPYRADAPALAVDPLGRLHAVWRYREPGGTQSDIVYRNSDRVSEAGDGPLDLGQADPTTRPALVCSSGNGVHVVWHTPAASCAYTYLDRDGTVDLTATPSSDDAVVTGSPALAVGADYVVRIVWEDGRHGEDEIYFAATRAGAHGMLTLGAPEGQRDYRLTASRGAAFGPAIGVSPWGQPSIVWKDTAYGTYTLAKYRPPWTCLIFLNGDNNLHNSYVNKISGWPAYASSFFGLEEMAYLPFVRLVVQFDGAGLGDTRRLLIGYDASTSENYAALRARYLKHLGHAYWYVGPDGASTNPAVNSERDMADPAVLTNFLTWGTTQFAAPQLLLAVVNHGNGWLPGRGAGARGKGISFDEGGTPGNRSDDSSMGMGPLRQALDNHGDPFHFDVLYFDACLMGMAEVAYEVKSYADFLVCSQAVSWANPHSYVLDMGTHSTPLSVAKSISSRYRDWCLAAKVGHHTTAVIRCRDVERFCTAVDTLVEPSGGLMTSPQLKRAYLKAWAESQHTDNDGRFTDIHSFCSHLQEGLRRVAGAETLVARAQTVMEILEPPGDDRLIVTELHDNGPMRDCHGLSIYFPFTRPDLVLAGCTEAEEERPGAFFEEAPPAGRAVDEGGYGAVFIRFPAEQNEGTVTLSRSNDALDIYRRDADTQADLPGRGDTLTPVLTGGQTVAKWNLANETDREALAELRDKLVAKGVHQGVTEITLTYTQPGASAAAFTDKATATIVHLDLDLDADNDGGIDADDEPFENIPPGKIFSVNDDNDDDENNDGLDQADEIDNRDVVVDGGLDENDMAELVLGLEATGLPATFKVALDVSDKQLVRIFDPSTPRVAIIGPTTAANPAAGAASWETTLPALGLPTERPTFLVEGVAPGQVTITLTLKTDRGEPIARKTVVATVVALDLGVDMDRKNGITFEDGFREDDPPGKLVALNSDSDGGDRNGDGVIADDELDYANTTVDGAADRLDFVDLVLGLAPTGLPGAHTLELAVDTAAPIRIFDASWAAVIGPDVGPGGTAVQRWSKRLNEVVLTGNKLAFHIEGLSPGQVTATLTYAAQDGTELASDSVVITAVEIKLEPIYHLGGPPPHNSSGIEKDKSSTYVVDIQPASVLDTNVVWTRVSGGISFPTGEDGGSKARGRTVTIKGDTLGKAKVRIDLESLDAPAPTLPIEVLEKKTIKAFVYVVRRDDGTGPAATPAQVSALLTGVNAYYQQVAMEFVQEGAIGYIDRTAWLDISAAANYQEANGLFASNQGTGGVEIYFVTNIVSALGLNLTTSAAHANRAIEGCVVRAAATADVVAHELGHAAGLDDVYEVYTTTGAGGKTTRLPATKANQAWAPEDWNDGPGAAYYDPNLTQPELIRRLIMYGTVSGIERDFPAGQVYGIHYDAVGKLIKVGLDGLGTRTPVHW